MKKGITISLNEKIILQLKKQAQDEHRTLTNLIECIIINNNNNKEKIQETLKRR